MVLNNVKMRWEYPIRGGEFRSLGIRQRARDNQIWMDKA